MNSNTNKIIGNIPGMEIVDALGRLKTSDAVELIEATYGNGKSLAERAAAYAILHTGRVHLVEGPEFEIYHTGDLSDLIAMIDEFKSGKIRDGMEVKISNAKIANLLGETVEIDIAKMFVLDKTKQWVNRRSGNVIEVHLARKLDDMEDIIRANSGWM